MEAAGVELDASLKNGQIFKNARKSDSVKPADPVKEPGGPSNCPQLMHAYKHAINRANYVQTPAPSPNPFFSMKPPRTVLAARPHVYCGWFTSLARVWRARPTWTRQRAIDYGIEASEVERYVMNPGQACAYMIGPLKLVELRDRARAALGSRFDPKTYHNAVLMLGTLPLTLLEAEVDRAQAKR